MPPGRAFGESDADDSDDTAGEQPSTSEGGGGSASPWWSAEDDAYSGATPLFGDRQRSSDDSEVPPPPMPEDVGTPVAEALKLAGAVMRWSEQSGLTDTLKQLAAEAAVALATETSSSDSPEPSRTTPEDASAESSEQQADAADDGTTNVTPITLHRWATGDSGPDGAGEDVLVCDYCPLCRGLAVMRTVQPQVSGGLSEAMASLTAALDYAVEGFVRRQRPGDR